MHTTDAGRPRETQAEGEGLIGTAVPRREDARLLTGRGRYVDDRQLPGMLHLALRRSDQAHARIRAIDVAAAAAMPGVEGVYVWADIAGLVQPAIASSRMADYHATPIYALARDKVRYVGEPVVAVLATNRYLAEDALEAIAIDYEPLPAESDPERALADGAPLLHDAVGSNVLLQRTFAKGDIDDAFATAAATVGGRFRFHRKTPMAIENRAYLAEPDPGRDALVLSSATQVPGIIRDALCDLLGMPGTRLRVVAPDVGGGFGGKTSLYQEEVLVCVFARLLGRPVKWTGDRLEDLISTSQGFDERIDAELAVDADGQILGLRAEVVGDVGAYSIYPWTAVIEPVQVVSFMPGPYRIANYLGRVRGVSTPKAPLGPYRGVGRPISTFVMERLIDMAARKLGIDPREMRLRNLVAPDQFPYKTAVGIVWDRSGFTEGLLAATERFDYAAARAAQAKAREEGRWVGIGMATYAELSGIGSRISVSPGMPINTGTETCVMRMDSTGAISAAFGTASVGQGVETTLAQVVADTLGARLEDVEIIYGDSGAVPHGTGTYASRSAVLSGGAAQLAAQEMRQRMTRIAGYLLDASPDDIEVAQSCFVARHTGKTLRFVELAKALYSQMGRVPKEVREDLDVTRVYDPVFGTTSSATHLVQVEIDPRTLAVHVDRYVVAEDCGRVINPMIVEGQVRGAVVQGIGAALLEEVVYDDGGQMLSASLVDYLVPSAPEAPRVEVVHLDSHAESTLGGFRGMGEGGTIGAPAAIANAIADALAPLGLEVHELPMSPDRLFRLVQGAKTNTR